MTVRLCNVWERHIKYRWVRRAFKKICFSPVFSKRGKTNCHLSGLLCVCASVYTGLAWGGAVMQRQERAVVLRSRRVVRGRQRAREALQAGASCPSSESPGACAEGRRRALSRARPSEHIDVL